MKKDTRSGGVGSVGPVSMFRENVVFSMVAAFSEAVTHTLTLVSDHSVDSASIVSNNPEGTVFNAGDRVSITAIPSDELYLFKEWTGDIPAGQEGISPTTVTMDSNRAITATFNLHE